MTVCLHLPFFFVHTNCTVRYKLSIFSTAIFLAGLTPFFGHAFAAELSSSVEPKKRAEQVAPVTKKDRPNPTGAPRRPSTAQDVRKVASTDGGRVTV